MNASDGVTDVFHHTPSADFCANNLHACLSGVTYNSSALTAVTKQKEYLSILWKERNSKPTIFTIRKMFQLHSEQLRCKFKPRRLNSGVRKRITCLTETMTL